LTPTVADPRHAMTCSASESALGRVRALCAANDGSIPSFAGPPDFPGDNVADDRRAGDTRLPHVDIADV